MVGIGDDLVIGLRLIQILRPHAALGVVAARVAAADGGADVGHQLVVVATRGNGAVVLPVAHVVGFGNLDVGEIGLVARGIFEHVVRRLEVQFQEEGLVRVALGLEPFQRRVGNAVGRVPFHSNRPFKLLRPATLFIAILAALRFRCPRLIKDGVEKVALPRQHLVVVERRRPFLEVPLADDGGLVARLLHFKG